MQRQQKNWWSRRDSNTQRSDIVMCGGPGSIRRTRHYTIISSWSHSFHTIATISTISLSRLSPSFPLWSVTQTVNAVVVWQSVAGFRLLHVFLYGNHDYITTHVFTIFSIFSPLSLNWQILENWEHDLNSFSLVHIPPQLCHSPIICWLWWPVSSVRHVGLCYYSSRRFIESYWDQPFWFY